MSKELILYTLHRFAVYAAQRRFPYDQRVLKTALDESGIESFGALVELDEVARIALGRRVLEHQNPGLDSTGTFNITRPGRLRESTR